MHFLSIIVPGRELRKDMLNYLLNENINPGSKEEGHLRMVEDYRTIMRENEDQDSEGEP